MIETQCREAAKLRCILPCKYSLHKTMGWRISEIKLPLPSTSAWIYGLCWHELWGLAVAEAWVLARAVEDPTSEVLSAGDHQAQANSA
jgi:hypothetical protein